jgi:putative flippase GtrA
MNRLTAKLKAILSDREEMMEILRYLIAGGLTTLLSLVITYGCEMLLSADHTINGANTVQVMVSTLISWVVAVMFAFWINRRMVFRVKGGTRQTVTTELLQFVGARLVSWAVIEEGIAVVIKLCGVSNFWNRLIVLVLVTIFNYVASKFWIFKPKAPQAAGAAETVQAGKAEGGR